MVEEAGGVKVARQRGARVRPGNGNLFVPESWALFLSLFISGIGLQAGAMPSFLALLGVAASHLCPSPQNGSLSLFLSFHRLARSRPSTKSRQCRAREWRERKRARENHGSSSHCLALSRLKVPRLFLYYRCSLSVSLPALVLFSLPLDSPVSNPNQPCCCCLCLLACAPLPIYFLCLALSFARCLEKSEQAKQDD